MNIPGGESFAVSWPTLMCDQLSAECHYNAWSGFGMVSNCCGGGTLASDVWTRTIASVGSSNKSDPHGTIPSNVWNFSKWKADAVVINLGTKYLFLNLFAPRPVPLNLSLLPYLNPPVPLPCLALTVY